MLFKPLALFSLLLTSASAEAVADNDVIEKRALTFPYGQVKVRGVNLGGWFVLEPWITPSIFDSTPGAVDEWTLCQRLGASQCLSRLRNHWATFYQASHFTAIKNAGLNHVRIPIGYWAVKKLPNGGDPYVQGQLQYLDRAIQWAGAAGLKVWIDLHGAPGSQNGFDNSGLRDRLNWQVGNNVAHTREVIRILSRKYAASSFNNVVTAIELINEPMGPLLDMNRIRQYFSDGYGIVRQTNDIAVVIADAFQPITSWNGFMRNPNNGWHNVILDTHQYQVFSPGELQRPIEQHIGHTCWLGGEIAKSDKWTIVGEWSGALTDCARHLNGVGRGARWNGNFAGSPRIGSCNSRDRGSISQFSKAERDKTRRYIEAQLNAYERGAGWFFWTWKTQQGAPQWDMRDLIAQKVFPQPINQRLFQRLC